MVVHLRRHYGQLEGVLLGEEVNGLALHFAFDRSALFPVVGNQLA